MEDTGRSIKSARVKLGSDWGLADISRSQGSIGSFSVVLCGVSSLVLVHRPYQQDRHSPLPVRYLQRNRCISRNYQRNTLPAGRSFSTTDPHATLVHAFFKKKIPPESSKKSF